MKAYLCTTNQLDERKMKHRITTLLENCVYGRKLRGEHGLSMFVESGHHKLLFDTGQSDLFAYNAQCLGIDLREVEFLILSHGHSDHTGGLAHFLEVNTTAKVVCKREVLNPKYKDERENGLTGADRLDLSRFWFIDEPVELVPGVFVMPNLEIEDEADTHFDHFYTKVNGVKIPDTFEDELAVVLTHDTSCSLLSACSHRGITNIIRSVRNAFPYRTIDTVIGGFHIHNAPNQKFETIATFFKQCAPKRIGVCHCSGVDMYALFIREFGEQVFYNHTGRVTEIGE